MGDNGSWIMRKRSDANQVDRPTEYAPVQPQQEGIVFLPLLLCGNAESGVSGSILGQLQAWRRRLSQLDPTRVHPAAAPLRPSTVFAPDHPPLVPKWFMFCGSCFCAIGSVLSKALPWKSLTTVSPRLCCVLAALLASSLPPVVLLLLLRPPILRSPALA